MPTTTPNLGLSKPTVNADADQWGTQLNASLDTLDLKVLDKSTGGTVNGALSATSFSGDGAGLTGLNATNITTGTLANARTTATNANTASAIVSRDASGNFSAGTITASLSGNATTATTAANGGVTSVNGATGAVTINQSTPQGVFAFFSNGTFTVPSGVSSIQVEVIGGGGGSGQFTRLGANSFSSGGRGGFARAKISVTPGQNITVTVGAAGTGSATSGVAGTSGGTSSVLSVSATGGGGGGAAANTNGANGAQSGSNLALPTLASISDTNGCAVNETLTIRTFGNEFMKVFFHPGKIGGTAPTAYSVDQGSLGFSPGDAGVVQSGGIGGAVIIYAVGGA